MKPYTQSESATPDPLTLQRNIEGYPLIASFFGGKHGYCGEYLKGGRVCMPRRDGATSREILPRDMVFDDQGTLYPATSA